VWDQIKGGVEVDHQLPSHSELEVVKWSLHSEQRERDRERETERPVPAPDQQYFNFNYGTAERGGTVVLIGIVSLPT
jgi:hypothetical protein